MRIERGPCPACEGGGKVGCCGGCAGSGPPDALDGATRDCLRCDGTGRENLEDFAYRCSTYGPGLFTSLDVYELQYAPSHEQRISRNATATRTARGDNRYSAGAALAATHCEDDRNISDQHPTGREPLGRDGLSTREAHRPTEQSEGAAVGGTPRSPADALAKAAFNTTDLAAQLIIASTNA